MDESTADEKKRIYYLDYLRVFATFAVVIVHVATQNWYNMSINVSLEAIAVFIFFKYNFNKQSRFQNLVIKLSKYSFGVYLVHVMIMDKLYNCGFTTLSFNPLISVPILTLIVYIISYIISAIINNIPVLKKYIV